jgi:hypothetical protein
MTYVLFGHGPIGYTSALQSAALTVTLESWWINHCYQLKLLGNGHDDVRNISHNNTQSDHEESRHGSSTLQCGSCSRKCSVGRLFH